MNTASASPNDLPQETPGLAPSRRVIDAPTRALHWLLAFSFSGAYLSAESERWHLVHITLGYTVLGLVLARLVWGLVGPKRVGLAAWLGKLRGLPQQLRAWPQGRGNLLASYQGLNTLVVVALLLAALSAALTGLGLEQEWFGNRFEDLLEGLHELLGNATLMVVLAHLALIAGVSLLRRHKHFMPMLSGRMPGKGPDLVKQNMSPLALLLVTAVLGFWGWQWQDAPSKLTERPAIGAGHHETQDDED
ncbi:cytochrome b/b6 domain-containing protein [Roseateles oligotrophus]|uniref:Cytochrome b/b6 domain-containing protein n=1 Tax=Roseateles oligotrophus TaxID=1769250 RepID=A0ABT2YCW8_9BURK|nr:cytochrome b/b6 domain-containing protein [Roseateles oligotrophus]MCV2367869.1 cytochrome b/b6 domain-containing protein [Roseateles oligotrophus]